MTNIILVIKPEFVFAFSCMLVVKCTVSLKKKNLSNSIIFVVFETILIEISAVQKTVFETYRGQNDKSLKSSSPYFDHYVNAVRNNIVEWWFYSTYGNGVLEKR